MPEGPAIQTVQRAAAMLSAFSVDRPRLTLSEITAELRMSKATAHRYARALRAANLLRYDPSTATYTLGPRILALEAAARAALPIVTAAEPYLERLVRHTGHTAVLTVWNGDCPTVVRCLDNTAGDVRLSVRTGAQLDSVRSAQGRVFCAFLPPADAPTVARRIAASAELRRVVDEVRRAGIASNASNTDDDHGVRVLAAPVLERRQIVAALAVMGTSVALTGEAGEKAVAALRRVAAELSRDLGATP